MKTLGTEVIARHSLRWLLVAQIGLLLPLVDNATPWSLGICAICFIWRLGIYLGKVAKPPRALVTTLGIGSAVTLGLIAKEIGLLNALINLLLLGYSLKFIEIRNRRDVRVVVLAGYFLIALNFIDSQSILNAAFILMLTGVNTSVLLTLYHNRLSLREPLAFKMLLQSLPLALLLFLVLPRLAPLWLVPQLKTGQTGLSDTVNPGDIAKLTKSDALAFRATFEGQIPANPQLYWRALVLENYDGRQWRLAPEARKLQKDAPFLPPLREANKGTSLDYEIIAEASREHWLFGLDVAYSPTQGVSNLPDFSLYAHRSLEGRFHYQVSSVATAAMDPRLGLGVKQRNLALPQDSNPRTLALAQQFQEQYPAPNARLDAMMNLFNKEAFFYTLTPPTLGEEQIDDFLFNTRRGFCAHYASALVFLARATGIPARMVTGYQGGEFNSVGGYLSVYQYMAHAWVEVWLEGRGWQRLDPTAMIAPSRILDGFDATFNPDEAYLQNSPLSPLNLKQYPWLNELRLRMASLDYYWSLWVLGFDGDRQRQLLSNLLGGFSIARLALLVLIGLGGILLLVAWQAGLLRQPKKKDPLLAAFTALEQSLAKRGLKRSQGEGPRDYCDRAISAFPSMADDLKAWQQLFLRLRYGPALPRGYHQSLRKLKRDTRRLRLLLRNAQLNS
ncbi:transglutaminase TgpA family protein [Shewanella cyperi]|uniref:transglutaminase TgpA family protein n=1 Tax=Shewanella cyperi TaxID=2814292 RepID=UPI001A948E9D|nr:DUF3488 and transglutaminase-like domain-containing protein [Shewanella cyperi]QSX42343.1 DUF3488 domain-containing transglutaminase family protein [Shewanella cyperi]